MGLDLVRRAWRALIGGAESPEIHLRQWDWAFVCTYSSGSFESCMTWIQREELYVSKEQHTLSFGEKCNITNLIFCTQMIQGSPYSDECANKIWELHVGWASNWNQLMQNYRYLPKPYWIQCVISIQFNYCLCFFKPHSHIHFSNLKTRLFY